MRQNIKNFAKIISKTIPVIEPLYEFGSLQIEQQIGFDNEVVFYASGNFESRGMKSERAAVGVG